MRTNKWHEKENGWFFSSFFFHYVSNGLSNPKPDPGRNSNPDDEINPPVCDQSRKITNELQDLLPLFSTIITPNVYNWRRKKNHYFSVISSRENFWVKFFQPTPGDTAGASRLTSVLRNMYTCSYCQFFFFFSYDFKR